MRDSSTITDNSLEYDFGNGTNRIACDLIVDAVGPRRTTSSYSCDWLGECSDETRNLRSLPEGWDSYSAIAPDPRLLEAGVSLIRGLCSGAAIPRPDVAPTPNGGVQFSWSNGKRYFEIEIVGEGAAIYMYEDTDTNELYEGELFVQEFLDDVIDLIKRVGNS